MNVENMLAVADAIENNPQLFNMERFGCVKIDDTKHPCGTPGCIGGWAAAFARTEDPSGSLCKASSKLGRHYLGLSYEEADALFFGTDSVWYRYQEELNLEDGFDILENVTSDMAVMMLRKLASGEWTFPEECYEEDDEDDDDL